MANERRTAAFAAGCFWGVEEAFRALPGVTEVTVGFMGGHVDHPSYEDVCTGTTGHAETALVTYDPATVSFKTLLDAFWAMHDPTQYHRQGPDVGSQYRSAIFYSSEEECREAEDAKRTLEASKRYTAPIVTEILPRTTFWPAAEYHQRYFEKRGGGTCHI